MLIASRSGFVSDANRRRNPYVTDGLVAMWDGVWNAGRGVHDASAASWVDLTGNGNQMTLETGTWGNNCWIPGASQYGYVSDLSGLSCLGDVFTLEILSDTQQDNTTANASVIYATDSTGVKLVCNVDAYSGGVHTAYAYRRATGNTRTDLGSFSSPVSISTTHSSGKKAYYRDGAYSTSSNDDYSSVVTPSTFWINRGYFGYGKEKFFAIRVYSRALTAAEIASNYAVDKRRFGL